MQKFYSIYQNFINYCICVKRTLTFKELYIAYDNYARFCLYFNIYKTIIMIYVPSILIRNYGHLIYHVMKYIRNYSLIKFYVVKIWQNQYLKSLNPRRSLSFSFYNLNLLI